jgi:hypothetical protein
VFFGLYRLTDRYDEGGRGFVVCTDRLTDMAMVVGGLLVSQTDRDIAIVIGVCVFYGKNDKQSIVGVGLYVVQTD